MSPDKMKLLLNITAGKGPGRAVTDPRITKQVLSLLIYNHN